MALARRVRTVRATATVGALLGGGFLEHEAAKGRGDGQAERGGGLVEGCGAFHHRASYQPKIKNRLRSH